MRKHLIPGLGAHKLDQLKPGHTEHLYGRMLAAGSKPGTAHQVHRTFRTALHDARHTAATVLLIHGVPERAVMG